MSQVVFCFKERGTLDGIQILPKSTVKLNHLQGLCFIAYLCSITFFLQLL